MPLICAPLPPPPPLAQKPVLPFKINELPFINNLSSVRTECQSVLFSTKFTVIGVDPNLNLQEQIHRTCKSRVFHLYHIQRIRKYLSQESARTLVHAYIIGRINYCNSLLFGLPSVHLLKLQRLQNEAAWLISNVPLYSHITPVLCSLLWLPVKLRIDFKILLLTFIAT